MSERWLDACVEFSFLDVGFGVVDALECSAGVEDEAVGTVADDVAFSMSVSQSSF